MTIRGREKKRLNRIRRERERQLVEVFRRHGLPTFGKSVTVWSTAQFPKDYPVFTSLPFGFCDRKISLAEAMWRQIRVEAINRVTKERGGRDIREGARNLQKLAKEGTVFLSPRDLTPYDWAYLGGMKTWVPEKRRMVWIDPDHEDLRERNARLGETSMETWLWEETEKLDNAKYHISEQTSIEEKLKSIYLTDFEREELEWLRDHPCVEGEEAEGGDEPDDEFGDDGYDYDDNVIALDDDEDDDDEDDDDDIVLDEDELEHQALVLRDIRSSNMGLLHPGVPHWEEDSWRKFLHIVDMSLWKMTNDLLGDPEDLDAIEAMLDDDDDYELTEGDDVDE